MKALKYLGILAIACVITITINSCGKDEPSVAKPTITLTEVGHDNSHHAHPGHDMHLEADIVAPGTIGSIHVVIEQVGGDTKIKQDYTSGKYIGVNNTEFHEHIDIPAEAPLGKYTLHFTVADKLGQQTTVNTEINMEEGDEEPDHDHE